MAHWTEQLPAARFDYVSATVKRWIWSSGRPSIAGGHALNPSPTAAIYLFAVVFVDDATTPYIDFHLSTSDTTDVRADLSAAFESGGKLGITVGTTRLVTGTNADTAEPYRFSFADDDDFDALFALLGNTDGATAGSLTVWDGAGTDPFADAPTFSSATTNAAGTAVVITFSENLDDAHVPAASAFNVQVAGARRTVSSVSIDDDEVTLTLASAVTAGQTVTVAYTQPASGQASTRLQNAAGDEVATFAAQAVTNAVPAPSELPFTVTLANVFALSTSAQWSGSVPASKLTSSSAQTLEVSISESSRTLDINLPTGVEFLSDIETDGKIVFENASGTVLFEINVGQPSFNNYGRTLTAAETTALLGVGSGNLVLRFQVALIGVEGIGSATFRTPPAAVLTRTPMDRRFAGTGQATFRAPPAAVLTRTAPAARKFEGIGSATFRTPPAAVLTVSSSLGSLPYNTVLTKDVNTGSSQGWAEAAAGVPAALTESSGLTILAIRLQGSSDSRRLRIRLKGVSDDFLPIVEAEANFAFWRASDDSFLFNTSLEGDTSSPYDIPISEAVYQRFIGVGSGDIDARIHLPNTVRVTGTGQATFRAPSAAVLTRTAPTARRFAGIGQAVFRAPPAAVLTRTPADQIRFSGIGQATFRPPVAATLTVFLPPPEPTGAITTKLAISSQEPSTFDEAGFGALTFSECGEVQAVGEFGVEYAIDRYQTPSDRAIRKEKSSWEYGTMTVDLLFDRDDAGQSLLEEAERSDDNYSFRVTLPDPGREMFLFQGLVMSLKRIIGGPDDSIRLRARVELSDKGIVEQGRS